MKQQRHNDEQPRYPVVVAPTCLMRTRRRTAASMLFQKAVRLDKSAAQDALRTPRKPPIPHAAPLEVTHSRYLARNSKGMNILQGIASRKPFIPEILSLGIYPRGEGGVSPSARPFAPRFRAPARFRHALFLTLFSVASLASAQGILTVTPTRSTSTLAGTGTLGYSGDNGAATSATLASPSAVAYDSAGNLYIADANNHVIRKVSTTGTITTVAGTGLAGFSGDGAAATAATLDTPTGIAVDASGNLYIADSHNNRIREVSGTIITTIAATGTKGFSGDNGPATAAQLNLPSAVAVDASGNVYIADTNNQRIRKVSTGTISTIAGTGEQNYTGDNAAATAATLDSPTGVAVDTAGNVYIADRHNQRIREITAGTITTIAGSGTPTFAGGFSGDGASSTAAQLSKPTGVSVDAAGNVYLADTNNQRIRQLGGGVIATVAGTGAQGFANDGGPSTSAILNAPKAAAPDANGNLALADTLDERIRSGMLGALTFTPQPVGAATTPQTITVANTGTAPITVSTVAFTGPFAAFAGATGSSTGSCGIAPFTLTPGAICAQSVVYTPTSTGAASGSVAFGGTGVVNQKVLLAGSGVVSSTTTTITSSVAQPVVGQAITFTAQIAPVGAVPPTGSVQFYANGAAIGNAIQVSASGLAALTTSFSTAGTYTITAKYSGDANFTTSTSASFAQTIADFTIALSPASSASQTVQPGQTANYAFTLTPLSVPFPYAITFAASGLPPGATATFTPATVTLGSTPGSTTMAVKTARLVAALHRGEYVGGSTLVFALLLLPFGLKLRKRGVSLPATLTVAFFLALAGVGLTGCGTGSGFFGQAQQNYTITVTASATGSNGVVLQHVTTVQIAVE